MARKNFMTMTNKKLNALLATASPEDKKAIEQVLAAREARAIVNEAPAAEEAPAKKVSTKMTDAERSALAEKLKENINHRCQAVPFNTIEWVNGFIAGVIEDKRSNKILYAIKTDDGRRIVKVHDSNLVRILDEVIEPEKRTRARKTREAVERIEWTPEAIAEEINEVIGNVGKTIELEKYRTTDENGEEHIETITGRITAIVPDKRAQRLLYRISVPTPVEGNPLAAKIMHKVVKSEGLVIAAEFDAEGAELNAKYCERREAAATRTPVTPQDRYVKCEENLKKAEEKLQKAQTEFDAKKQQLEDAKKELDEYLAAQETTPAENTENEEPVDELA